MTGVMKTLGSHVLKIKKYLLKKKYIIYVYFILFYFNRFLKLSSLTSR